MEKDQRIQLGCGTLILIAVIVAVFSGKHKDYTTEFRGLQQDTRMLETMLKAQQRQLDSMAQTLKELKAQSRPAVRPLNQQ